MSARGESRLLVLSLHGAPRGVGGVGGQRNFDDWIQRPAPASTMLDACMHRAQHAPRLCTRFSSGEL